eukprot:784843-Pleurochrysis_carterae.AAC.2
MCARINARVKSRVVHASVCVWSVCVRACACVHLRASVRACVCVCVCVRVRVRVRACACACVCARVFVRSSMGQPPCMCSRFRVCSSACTAPFLREGAQAAARVTRVHKHALRNGGRATAVRGRESQEKMSGNWEPREQMKQKDCGTDKERCRLRGSEGGPTKQVVSRTDAGFSVCKQRQHVEARRLACCKNARERG